jgi:YidC/Oxa1 family membrane protein insertase
MNNKRSPVEQMITIALLSFVAFWLSQQFFGNNKNKNVRPEKTVPSLALAFKGLHKNAAPLSNGPTLHHLEPIFESPKNEAPLSKDAALKEISALQNEIASNGKDEYSYWARLRVGLLQQYVLHNAAEARKFYEEVIGRHKNEAVDAQALYQKGDLLWRLSQSKTNPEPSTPPPPGKAGNATDAAKSPAAIAQIKAGQEKEGATTLDQFLIRSRGHKAFLELKIFVPDAQSATGDPLQIPAQWEELSLEQLMGKGSTLPGATSSAVDPRSILTRVNAYYSTTTLYKIFDTVVGWFGAQPAYSYGLALIVLALVTRLIMQPLIKKQYEGMKGMQLIGPEMKKIQEKYKGKSDQESQMRMMKEIRELQKAHGVNPMGCGLSLVVQIPLFFWVVWPLISNYQARMELSGAHFGWIASLAHPDIPLLVIYAISMFVSTRLSSTPAADPQQAQMQKMTMFMSPLFALFLWSYPSAFILYWITYNVLSTVFQWRMMKGADPDKTIVKTLLGTGAPVPATATASALENGSNATSGAIPPRPAAKANSLESKVSQNGASPNGVATGVASQNGKAGTGAARRRRRRK